uniref:Uncharacterized protein n=1 Tax=viral metagenome TaxID=1070528 RepID=A0A6H2A1J6_9ZZZZ
MNYSEFQWYNCPKCKELIQKCISKEGSRLHVHSYDSEGIHCSEGQCEVNHKCKKDDVK